ncbi:MAG: acetate--CoA ligase family protein [Anaerolineae bacterium]|nr:acetate--CoA ligase family protein [Anaerolineae bacterium]
MKILECEAKALLRQYELPIPAGEIVQTAEAAHQAADRVGGSIVLKIQVPSGRRMKAGGVLFAEDGNAAEQAAALLGREMLGFTVEHVLIEQKLNIAQEIYVAVTYDAVSRRAVLVASIAGGIEVETSAESSIVRRSFSVSAEVPEFLGREVAAELGFTGKALLQLGQIISKVAACFLAWDALLLELNPVVLDKQGRFWIADVHLELDDDALYRQNHLISDLPLSAGYADRRSEFERAAAAIDHADHRGVAGRLIPFPGTLGLLIGGGGASLTAMDAVLNAGLDPANYCEIGGNPSVWKIKELTKLILSQERVKQLAVIMNVVSNTRVDLIARGVIKGILELGRDPAATIAAFRIPGSWEDEGSAILDYYGVRHFGRETSIDQVVDAIKRGNTNGDLG